MTMTTATTTATTAAPETTATTMSPSTIWITGGHGMLGSRLATDARAAGHDVLVSGREVDIANAVDVAVFIAAHRPAVIVNCAAYTAVDKAEQEQDEARRINVLGASVLATAAATIGARLVNISTDYVFDGDGSVPLDEQMPTAPRSVYGHSKRDGELAILAATDTALIVRTSWLYAATHKNFVRTMLTLMADRDQLRVVSDQRGRPTSTTTLSTAILALLDVDAAGIVHVADATGAAGISWHDFAVAIREDAVARGLPVRVQGIEAIATAAYPTPAARPAWSVFSTTRYEALTGLRLPAWRASLATVLDTIVANR